LFLFVYGLQRAYVNQITPTSIMRDFKFNQFSF